MKRQNRRHLLAGALFGLASLWGSVAFDPMARIIWNASASAPIGLYALSSSRVFSRGDLVLVALPKAVGVLAAERHYLPAGVGLIKRIAALSGDEVCRQDRRILINGKAVAEGLAQDGQGRSMPSWSGCRRLDEGDVFLLLKDVPDSFDGRYFGILRKDVLLGRLTPLWTR